MNKPNPYLIKLKEVIGINNQLVTFLHNAPDEVTAQNIIEHGFKFLSHIDYTTDIVSGKDDVTISYFSLIRNAYGDYTIVIQIDKAIIEKYSNLIDDHHFHYSTVLTIDEPEPSNDGDLIYLLSPNFVKGYVHAKTGLFTANPRFNPSLDLPVFMQNLNNFINTKKS